ncbi:hypothetical protein O3P69_003076 [Scylla paramamosain]|uniref:Tc1-like transposase DDE domain-containing protein n=1 Tax=Scylla paramamosain TaxID=85552 RepID=A0AAW0UPL4_SCYPA
MKWRDNSPDLNPIENAWKVLKKVTEAHVSSVPQLQEVITRVWCQDMTLDYFRSPCESMPQRILTALKAKGEMTGYKRDYSQPEPRVALITRPLPSVRLFSIAA